MKTVHIAQGASDPSQDGSFLWPYRVKNADEFDEIFRVHREPTRFILAPGEYRTCGCWNLDPALRYAMLAPNASLIGTHGSNATFVRLDDDYAEGEGDRANQAVETIIGGGYNSKESNQMEVSGITIDNSAANRKNRPSIGVHLWSGGAVIEDVRVIGVCGNWDTLVEGFSILISDSVDARNGGCRIQNCRVENDTAMTYYNGIYLACTTPGQAPNLIENCYATAVIRPAVRRSHTAYAANENTLIRNCTANGYDRFLFSDTANAGDIEVDGCRADVGYCAVEFPALPSPLNPIAYRRRFRIINSTFTNFNPSNDHAVGIMFKDQSEGKDKVIMEDIDVDGCRFRSSLPQGRFFACSIQAALAKRIWIRNTAFPPWTPTDAGVFPPTPDGEVKFSDLTFV